MRTRRVVRVVVGVCALALAACGRESESGASTQPAIEILPGTDIWLADLRPGEGGRLGLIGLKNITHRPGYDNQPFFTPDGGAILYTAMDDAGQADTWRYDIAADSAVQVTHTAPESEYSPTPMPSGSGFSAVRVEADSTQRLWRFDSTGEHPSLLLTDVEPVGYHTWVDDSTVVLFVLGSPPTLQVADLATGSSIVRAKNIGRSLNRIPGTHDVSFVQRVSDDEAWITRLDPSTGATERLVRAVDGGDFHAWAPDGTLLMASGGRIYTWKPGTEDWIEGVDLSALGLSLSRIAVSPAGDRIALVAEAAEAPAEAP